MKRLSRLAIQIIIVTILITFLSSSAFTSPAVKADHNAAASISQETNYVHIRANDDTPNEPEWTHTLYFPIITVPEIYIPGETSWPMVAANPKRTSWTPEEVSGNLHIEWYRPIEAYIPQNFQIIAANGNVYISTARGLYALNAANGNTAWRFDTEVPLGNSPTVDGNVLYVGGLDRKLHVLNAITGAYLWSFDGAKAGFDTNPVVINGKVILGNRDGAMYAIGAHGSANQGQLIWKFQTDGSIHYSPAYNNGVIYFASNDNHAYALNANNGSLIWKSQKLPGDGYHTYWPVVYRDKVIFSASSGYRNGLDPGTTSLTDPNGDPYGQTYYLDRDGIFEYAQDGSFIGPLVADPGWANGFDVRDASAITEYLEDNPNFHTFKHKPWRRVTIILNQSNGSEYTFDSDGDGYRETIPVANWGTQSGNRYPPLVGSDDLLYIGNILQKFFIAQGRVMGWNINDPRKLKITLGQGAVDEPQAISAGGDIIYRNISGDNASDWFNMTTRGGPYSYGALFNYSIPLSQQAPGYDEMIYNHHVYGNSNGIYTSWGIQNAVIPYDGRLFVHRSNAIIAYGEGPAHGKIPLLQENEVVDPVLPLSVPELQSRLEVEVQKMINAGHLRPGYYNNGMFRWFEFLDYFANPGETLYTLSIAYPHLSPGLQAQTRTYLASEFASYFNPMMYATMGWNDGAAREAMPWPIEPIESIDDMGPRQRPGPRFTWSYPPFNFYAMWKYSLVNPEETTTIYNLAKSKIQVPVPEAATNALLAEKTWEHNSYIAGYIGFLELQTLAGMEGVDSQLRQQVNTELNRLLQLRVANFDKNSKWSDRPGNWQHLNIAHNFMYIVPELGDYLRANNLNEVRTAINEYEMIGSYWFVARYEAVPDEGAMSGLFNTQALFQAKAFILNEPRSELTKWLDIPGFARGDLFYMQNLVAAIEANP